MRRHANAVDEFLRYSVSLIAKFHEITMRRASVKKVNYHSLRFSSRNGRQKIAVACENCSVCDLMFGGEQCEVHTQQNVYTLLFEPQLPVFISTAAL